MKKTITLVLLGLLCSIGNVWATDATYVPQGLKTISSDEIIYYSAIRGSSENWFTLPSKDESDQAYTQITSTTDNGNPHGITDVISSTGSNVKMTKVSTNGNTFSIAKKVVHMHVKGVVTVIAHGKTGSSSRGFQISATEYVSGSTTEMDESTHHVSFVRKSNGGCFLGQLTGLDASKEYIVSIYAASGDTYFYCAELKAPACTPVAAPTGLSCTAHTKNSLTFSWTAAEHASKYTATLYSDAGCTSQVASDDNVTTTSKTFSGLSGSTTYYCKVQSNGDGTTYCAEGGVTSAASETTDGKDYTVTAASNNNEWGTAAAGAGSLDAGETTNITATPESGYKFVSWTVEGTDAELSSTTTNPTTLTMGTANATVTATFRALYTYAITYDKGANGTGTIAAGEKTEDAAFTLSSSKFTRDGYVQTGWALTDGGSKAYDLGESYEENEDLDLYPVWTALDEQVDVTGNTTWDWADVTNGDKVEVGTDLNGKDVLFSNISKYGYTTISGLANQQALIMNGQRAYNNANGSKHCQVNSLKFNTTVAGIVTVEYANTGGNAARTVNVNGTKGRESVTDNSTYKSESFFVTAGSVTIKGVQVSDDADKMLRIRKVVFSISVSATIGTTGWTTFSSIAPLDLSDMTADHTVAAYYAYDAEGTDVMIRTTTATVPAGEGLLLKGTAGDAVTIPVAASGTEIDDNLLEGCTTSTVLTANAAHYVLVNNGGTAEFQSLEDKGATIPAGKAYLNLSGVSLAPGALRIVEEENQATSIEALDATENAVKFIQDGKLYIKKNNVVYDMMGTVVR